MLIDYNFCIERGACYNAGLLMQLFPKPIPLQHVLIRTDGPWKMVSPEDRLWVALQPGVLSCDVIRHWSIKILERVLGLVPIPQPEIEELIQLLRDNRSMQYASSALWELVYDTHYRDIERRTALLPQWLQVRDRLCETVLLTYDIVGYLARLNCAQVFDSMRCSRLWLVTGSLYDLEKIVHARARVNPFSRQVRYLLTVLRTTNSREMLAA